MAIRLRPELVVMDIQMPDMNGIEATRLITDASPNSNVLVVTMFEDDASVFAAMRAGARGYVLKGVRSAELLLSTVRAQSATESRPASTHGFEAVTPEAAAPKWDAECFGSVRPLST